MPGQYKFTGNPKLAQYTPRGLDYFTYLPQLKAKVRGAALQKANELVFDTTGLYKTDLDPAINLTKGIEQSRDKIVNDLISGEAITDSVVGQLTQLSRTKQQVDKSLKVAEMNAASIQKFNEKWDNYGAMKGNPLYAQRTKDEAMATFGSTFNEDGTVKKFEGYTPPKDVDVQGRIREAFQLASRNMTPAQRGGLSLNDFKVIQIPTGMIDPNTQEPITSYQLVHKNPRDIFTNNKALADALDTINVMFADENAEAFKYLNFMGEEYKQGIMNEANAMKDLYLLRDERASSIGVSSLGTDKTSGGSGSGKEGYIQDPLKLYEPSNVATVKRDPVVAPSIDDITTVTTTNAERQPGRGRKNTVTKVTLMNDKEYNSYQDQANRASNFLFGKSSLSDLSLFTAVPEQYKYNSDGTVERINTEDPFKENVLAQVTRKLIAQPEGTYGRGQALTLSNKIEKLVKLGEARGLSPEELFTFTVPKEEATAYFEGGEKDEFIIAVNDVLQYGAEMYNDILSPEGFGKTKLEDTSFRTPLLFNEPGFIASGITGGKIMSHDYYKENLLPRLLEEAEETEVLSYKVKPGSKGGAQYQLIEKSSDPGSTAKDEYVTMLKTAGHTAPRTIAKGYDYAKDLGRTGTSRYTTNEDFDQALAWEVPQADGSKIMYVTTNKHKNLIPNITEPTKAVVEMKGDKTRTSSLDNAIHDLTMGDSTTIVMPVVVGGQPVNYEFSISNEGGRWKVQYENYPDIPATYYQNKQDLMRAFSNLQQHPEQTQKILNR